jgi:preprotein translocase SecE subunit
MTSSTAAVKTSENKFTRFFTGIWSELKKVVWLSRKEVTYLTALVLLVAIVTGAFLWAVDLGFTTIIDKLLLNR